MSPVTRSWNLTGLPMALPGPVSRIGRVLAGALAAAGATLSLIALNLKALVGRFDTLAFLLQETHIEQVARLRLALLFGALALLAMALIALVRWRAALISAASGLLLAGIAAAPLASLSLAPQGGLEESLVYRLRGFSAIGVIGGLFLLFLSALPALLDRPAGRCERAVSNWTRRGIEGLQEMSGWHRRIVLGGVAFLFATSVGLLILQDFPNSSDENSYLTQARIFAAGKLWVAAPPDPEFFRARSFIIDEAGGRFFAKAFPGWAALLSLGVKAGAPWAVNPLLSAAGLILAGWAGGRLLGRHGELAVIAVILSTPFFVLNAASYFNHPATVLMVTLFLVAVIRLREGAGIGWAALAGLAAGSALWIRPAPALMLTIPLGLWVAWRWMRERRWGFLAAGATPLAAAVAALAAYNHRMFGSVWRTGYAAYDPGDIRPGLGADHLAITSWWLLKLCFWLVPGSLAGLWLLVRGRRLREWFQREPVIVLMLASLLGLALSYLVFQNKGGNEYGPRYYYDGITYLAILLCAGFMRAPEVFEGIVPAWKVRRATGLVLGCGAVLTFAGTLPFLLAHYEDKIAHNRDLFTTVERSGVSPALVFLSTGSGRMPPGDLVRNPLDFRTGVVYARDLGAEADRGLAALYPDRPALVYAYDSRARRSTLRPLSLEDGR
ncbi:MAG TPA: hypothetical protein VKF61_02320 [Candidatus Polarisedimenticolia bacterium]|nr:hypothetical protein [Candidatus Polarisedimenticolia bacterium]